MDQPHGRQPLQNDSGYNAQLEFINSLTHRLESFLPNVTGYSLIEVELNPQFKITKDLLIDRTKFDLKVYGMDYISICFMKLCNIIESINKDAKEVKLKDRDEKQLSSTLIILKILRELIEECWLSRTALSNFKSDVNLMNFEILTNFSFYYHFTPPKPINVNYINLIIDILGSLLSGEVIKRVLSMIQKRPIDGKGYYNSHSSNSDTPSSVQSIVSGASNQQNPQTQLGHNRGPSLMEDPVLGSDSPIYSSEHETAKLIQELDFNIEICLRFIATSNPLQYYNYLYNNLFKFSVSNEVVPPYNLQKYAPLIKYTFYSLENGYAMANVINKSLESIKNTTWKQIILVFYSHSVRDQAFARPEDYDAIVESSSEVAAICKSIFDQTCSIFEEFPYAGIASMVQTWVSMLNPSDYREYELKPNKLKLSFNKRLKFINNLIKNSTNRSNLTCFDSLITLYHLAARFPSNMSNHPVYIFTMSHLDETYEALVKVNLSTFSINLNSPNSDYVKICYDNLIVNFFIAAIMLKPEKYCNLLLNRFQSIKDSYRDVRIIVKVVRGLSEYTLSLKSFNQIMTSISPQLKSLSSNVSRLLSQYYENSISIHTSSSSASVYSDKASVSSSTQNNTRKLSFDQELSPHSSRILAHHHSHLQQQSVSSQQLSSHPQTISSSSFHDINVDELKFSSASISAAASTGTSKLVANVEDLLADLFAIFKASPQLFFNDISFMEPEIFYQDEDASRARILKFVQDNVDSLRVGLQSRSMNNTDDSTLFSSTCRLIMSIVDKQSNMTSNLNIVTSFANYSTCKQIVKSICDSCLSLSLTDVKFKSNLIFLNEFLEMREEFNKIVTKSPIVQDPRSHCDETDVGNSVERILLLSLCTHDIQFYNIVKDTMKWHLLHVKRISTHFEHNLADTFEKLVQDDFVFTGFVSLHKRFRNILRESRPTKALYQVWLIIYERWCDLLFNKIASLNEENLLFRHFTGFLVSTSGCFLSNEFADGDPVLRSKSEQNISNFFDRCINLLTSSDLVIRVIIKDALSNESHSAVYQLVSNKLVTVVNKFEENKNIYEESVLFTEQTIMIMTSMLSIPNEGAVVLTALLPEICVVLIKLINLVEDPVNQLRLKLRFCKLTVTIETNRKRLLLTGAYKIRNFYAKSTCDWLEQSAFFDELPGPVGNQTGFNYINSYKSSNSSTKSTNKDSELVYLNVDLATESSKALALQLEDLLLDIPEGTSEKDVPKYKDLSFANYFSLFYRILTKYTMNNSGNVKSKYKIQAIVDNVLKCITNILQYDTDIGLQLVFPLGYHDNKKIRALFLSVFAEMLYERKIIRKKSKDFTEINLLGIGSLTDILTSASVIASNQNHNLYASSLFGVYGYLHKLDELFENLLNEEINNVSRTADIFRRNSTLTKLLAKLAKDDGMDYLTLVLKDFVQEFNDKEINFNVEKEQDSNSNPDLFMSYLNNLVSLICDSADSMPKSFRYVCSQIYRKVNAKVPDASLIAVGSFVFLRFFCPAVISPESFFEIDVICHSNKKSLLQLVKVLQNMANKTLSVLKWKSLNQKMDELMQIQRKIFKFLQDVSSYDSTEYPFEEITEMPIPELRYVHKFFFTYYKEIKQNFLLGEFSSDELKKRVEQMTLCDDILREVGQPKALLTIQGGDGGGYKNFDPTGTVSSEYTEFMNRMSAKYADKAIDVSLIHNAIFHDGTPVVVVNLKTLTLVDFDVNLLVYKLFETASQVWDNKFYFVFDFTQFSTEMHVLVTYATLLNTYGPSQLFKNCTRIYYFNLPIKNVGTFFNLVKPSNVEDKEARARFYTYSHCDSNDIISSLCLSEDTMAITRDKKVEFLNCKVLDSTTQSFYSATIKIGRSFFLICSDEFIATNHELCATKGFRPVDIYSLSDITRCEITKSSGATDEFTIYFNSGQSVIVRSHERSEILRFMYFTTSRLPKPYIDEEDRNFQGDVSNLWFGRLFNIVFQSLLCEDDEVRSSASYLFASVGNYFEIEYSISKNHAKDIAYPANTTDFIVAVSKYLSRKFPEMSYRFFRSFFDCYDKLPSRHRINAILYLSPWLDNICDYIYLKDEQSGPDRVAGIIRQVCSISALNKDTISAINDYIWKKLFAESILTPLLLDEIVTFTMDNRNDDPDWSFIISVLSPSVELCGETITRLITCINEATNNDSEIAAESKLFEIMILVKICASLFFDSYIFAQLYLADVFFICSLFIDNPSLEFGGDLQKLVINTIQSFFNKPDLTEIEEKTVEETLAYFSGQRAKMLFGLTREKTTATSDINQLYNRAASFETLCDYLNEFITVLGSADDRSGWRSRWCSYAMDVAFSNSSLFQFRAILVVGILSKSGISDHTATNMLKLMSRTSFNNTLESMTNVLMSAAKIFKGLSKDSVFPSIIIWPELYLGMLNYSSLYQVSIQCLLNTLLKNYEQGPGFVDRVFEQRKHLESFIESFEKSHGFHIDKKNILCYVFFIFTQGLKLSHIKHTSLTCMKQVFKERYVIEAKDEYEVPSGSLPYLLFIWLSTNESSFSEYIATTEYQPSEWLIIHNLNAPKVIIDYLLSDQVYPTLALYQAAYIYATTTVDSGFKTRFLILLNQIFSINPRKGQMIFHIIKSELASTMINSNSTDTVIVVSEIMTQIMSDPTYSLEEHSNATDEFLKENGMMIMKSYRFRKLSDLLASDETAKEKIERDNERLQEMIYRSASSYVENEKLED
ncbi:Ras GTPase activating protein ira2 [Yamadazyma tenuis]|uniref:Ras-GAP domain-containing protein n=1 Tax=Candida tenuis (strain ATCC 10573 / BCRC 21748 / CBS 615 / JCM 9827 / NBRC 10315 / NRRL Y-1498 / VKM Y-70) TaxID=590646 RepID=G3B2M6_CANTC|nr:uncharacterized protein CANTEDRAFT_92954 [Yamadazyma tenuis ATCC 10573]EGV64718.1 hypothetical protein CANTEDRAFT_92954 [Yamadazyma tenuis ATCC 10573]WEJ97504.1 Ras GTPase activating protein ira2 [Yamadazyma tenuis]